MCRRKRDIWREQEVQFYWPSETWLTMLHNASQWSHKASCDMTNFSNYLTILAISRIISLSASAPAIATRSRRRRSPRRAQSFDLRRLGTQVAYREHTWSTLYWGPCTAAPRSCRNPEYNTCLKICRKISRTNGWTLNSDRNDRTQSCAHTCGHIDLPTHLPQFPSNE